MSTPFQIRAELVEFGKRLYQRNHVGDTEGNLSTRLPDGRIMITPSGVNKGYMKPEDMIICDAAGKKLQGAGRPSSEIKLHASIYNWRPDISAICHAHPIYATAYSTARKPLIRAILPEVVGTIGAVPLAQYAAPGSSELPETLAALIDRYDAFLLEAHGVLSLGKTIEDAFNKIETVERYAAILFVAKQIGDVKELPPREIERLLKQAGRLNIKDEILAASRAEGRALGQKKEEILPVEEPASLSRKAGAPGYR